MCFSRKEKKAPPPIRKKKLTCRQRCMRKCGRLCCNCIKRCIRKCCGCCCRRIKRCIRKKVFGVPNVPRMADYEVGGVDLAGIKSKFKLKDSATVLTLFQKALKIKNSKWNQSIKNIDLIEGYEVDELKRKFSVKGSKEKILRNMVNDYKKGRLSLSNVQKSKYDFRNLNKEQLNNIINDYVTAQKEKYEDLNADDLKNKFVVHKSQEKVLERMIDDYKKGKLSSTALSNNRGFDPKKLNQDKLDKMLQRYTEEQKDKIRHSLMGKLNANDIKKKFSIKGSKEKLLDNFIDDFKKGKASASKLASKTGLDPTKLNKNDIDNLLKKYEQKDKSFISKSLSKYKNLMEDFKSMHNIQTLIDHAKQRF